MKKTLVKSLALAFAGSLLMVGSALALPVITLTDTLNSVSVSVADGSALDTWNSLGAGNPDGVVVWSGVVGNWTLNVETGQDPVPGSMILPHLDLNSANTSSGAGDLKISFSDLLPTWDTGVLGLISGVGGTVSRATGSTNTATFNTVIGGVALNTLGAFTNGPFSGEAFIPTSGSASIDMIATLHHSKSGVTSFDWELSPVPEPATMLLLGTGLFGLAASRRRNQK